MIKILILKVFFNFSGAYAEWNYEDIKSLNYCPYTPFLFSFIVLILSCILIVCASCAMLNEYGHNRRESIERRRTARTNNRMDYEYLEWLKTKMNKNILNATTWWYTTLSSKGTFINDVPRFLAIFDLPIYIVLPYNVLFGGLSWTPLPTLIWDVINECSQSL